MAESFHSDTEVPATADANDGVALSTGFYFTVAVDGTITHARWRAANSVTGTVKWALYRLSDSAQLGVQSFTSYTQGAWNTIALNTPIPITAGVKYAAAYWSPNNYVATGAYFISSITRGDITTADLPSGRFLEPSADIAIPTSAFNSGCYFVDFVFSTGQAVAPASTNVPITIGQPTVGQTLTASPASTIIPISIGMPTVSGQPYVAPLRNGSWWTLETILDTTRSQIDWWNKRQPVACPNDGEPLRRSVDGILFCPFDNWRPDDQQAVPRRRAVNRDWGHLSGIKQAAARDAVFNQLVLSCPNDGEPLSIGKHGEQFCRYDGWMPDPVS